MRHLIFVAVLVTAAATARAEPQRLDERGVSLGRSDTLPRKSYAWTTWLLGTDDLHVVVSESEHADRPATYQAFDNSGAQRWTADHACPNFDDFTTIFAVDHDGRDARIVCKWRKQVIAVDLATGKEAWRFSDPRPLYITAGAQGRVAISIANEQLAVLDARDGREVMRIDTDGAVLEAVTATKDGPLAFLVWDTPTRVKDSIELQTGEGGALERIELSGDDPDRKLLAVRIGGPAKKGTVAITPLVPLWAAPFGGYSFEVTPSAGVVVGVPRENTRAAWDLASGKLLWERPMLDDELVLFGEDGGAFARPDASGNFRWGALDPKSLAVRWEKPLPPGEKPLAGGQGGGDLGLITSGGFQLVRYRDGETRHAVPIAAGLELANVRSTPRSLLWVTQKDTERWLHFRALPPL